VSVVVISHNIPELLQLVDRIEVMRLGQVVASLDAATATTTQIVGAMTGLDAEASG
jgi:simple sugar transport system ATP-binding protein